MFGAIQMLIHVVTALTGHSEGVSEGSHGELITSQRHLRGVEAMQHGGKTYLLGPWRFDPYDAMDVTSEYEREEEFSDAGWGLLQTIIERVGLEDLRGREGQWHHEVGMRIHVEDADPLKR
jgi:hypothetical protein